jgi:hypothetical protein
MFEYSSPYDGVADTEDTHKGEIGRCSDSLNSFNVFIANARCFVIRTADKNQHGLK